MIAVMGPWNFTTCSLLQVFFAFMLCQYVACVMKCLKPPDIENAKYEVKSAESNTPMLGSSAVYTCKGGYELDNMNASTLRCIEDKKSKQAIWVGDMPACKEKTSCPDPGVSKHGTRSGECCLSGTSLLFHCNNGYELVGEEIMHCLPMEIWSSKRPLCKPLEDHCPLPPQIPHGLVTARNVGDYFLPGEEAQVLCEPGYKCNGRQFVVCEKGGVWESKFGECTEILCDPPPPLANGAILELQSTNLTSFPYNFELTYVCDKGYRLIGDSWRVCGRRGWSGKTPACKVVRCPDPGIPEDGFRFRFGFDFSVGSSVHFSCFQGYQLLGSVDRYCISNGQWTGELARCDFPGHYCRNPGVPIRGYKNSTSYDLGDKVDFRCQAGYIQIGSQVRECLSDHTWSGTETKCLGKYDFDNDIYVRDTMKEILTQKVEDQRKELEEYPKLMSSLNSPDPTDRMTQYWHLPERTILYFVFDVSVGVGSQNFAKSIDFAKAIVKKVGISEHGIRAGALTFSSRVEMNFLPFHFNTTEDVLDALDRISYTGGGTAASSALFMIRTEYMPLVGRMFGNKFAKSIIFLLTDGKANMGGDPKREADSLKASGAEIYCVGITGDLRRKVLYDIASKSKNENGEEYPNVYILQNYNTLSWLAREITDETVDYSQCGLGLKNLSNANIRRREFGWDSKEPWPWMVTLYMQSQKEISSEYELICTGSIIPRHFILTAAHCLYDYSNSNPVIRHRRSITVKLGLTDTKNKSLVQEYTVKKMFIHPKFHPGNFLDYDIALLQLEEPIEYNPFVRPVCLPPKGLSHNSVLYRPFASAWATSWGQKGIMTRNLSDKLCTKPTRNLKDVYLPVQSRERCIDSMIDSGVDASHFTDRMFCAEDVEEGNDICRGDTGGPLIQSQVNPDGYLYWTQVGIMSRPIGGELQDTYRYFTHVQTLVPWIDDNIENALRSMRGYNDSFPTEFPLEIPQ